MRRTSQVLVGAALASVLSACDHPATRPVVYDMPQPCGTCPAGSICPAACPEAP